MTTALLKDSNKKIDETCINTLRFLSVDMVQKANSGHPGLPLGSAAMAYTLWDRFLQVNPAEPLWPNRDRFVLSAGHGSALLYALLHVSGFDLSIEDIKNFRQWQSKTPGHPEYKDTPGVEATTGPLGQGFANAVGMAIAEVALAQRYNKPEFDIVDHHTYVLVSDGDMMEGVASEAASLAGHLQLGKLIALYADNHITLSGGTDIIFTEDRVARFRAYGWHTQFVEDSNDVAALEEAIQAARAEKNRPSFIAVRTHIGYGSPDKQDTNKAHGEPLGVDEVAKTKNALGWPVEPAFLVPQEATEHFAEIGRRGAKAQKRWQENFDIYANKYSELAAEFKRVLDRELPDGWSTNLQSFSAEDGPMATREASGKILNVLAKRLPELMGGDADLAPSTHTIIEGSDNFEPSTPAGRNLRFGVREHAMGAILNGMALHRGFIPYGSTFLIFSDYMRPPMRLAAMNGLSVIYVYTHDSIAMGEDGPTHQPVEQLLGLRSVLGLSVIRPADANETVIAWTLAIESTSNPTALILTRQKLPVLDAGKYPAIKSGARKGGYILAETSAQEPDIVIVATGSEVHLALECREKLRDEKIETRIVSLPCWNLFESQSDEYKRSVIPDGIPLLFVEAGETLGWHSYLNSTANVIGVDKYGASAPGKKVMDEYGFSVKNVCEKVHSILSKQNKQNKQNKQSK